MRENPDFIFFQEAVLSMTASLDMSQGLVECCAFLSQHFPIEAISLHTLNAERQIQHLYFLVTPTAIFPLDRIMPISQDTQKYILHLRSKGEVCIVPNNPMLPLSRQHSECVADVLPFKERAYLLGILKRGKNVLGQLVLMGNAVNCFTEEHKRKLDMLMPHFSVAMSNMLLYQNSISIQKSLNSKLSAFEEDLELLRTPRFVGSSKTMEEVRALVDLLKNNESSVLILGETGTGKEVLTDAIQASSLRKKKPYIKVNCGALPEGLVDSELFGYRKGAFTGANSDRAGSFEQANGGTLFLDEIGELPLQVQVRLLRVLQNKTIQRLGDTTSIPVDVRIIAATNRNLEKMLRNGTFREDLYYRLNIFPIRLPPLRERKEDIPALILFFIKKICVKFSLPTVPDLNFDTLDRLLAYSWPGNARELENLIERALVLYPSAKVDISRFLPKDPAWYLSQAEGDDHFTNSIKDIVRQEVRSMLMDPAGGASNFLPSTKGDAEEAFDTPPAFAPLKPLEQHIKEHILRALEQCKYKIHGKGGAAELLGMNPNTLRKKMEKMGIAFRG